MSLHSTTDTIKKIGYGIGIIIGGLIMLAIISSIIKNILPKKPDLPTVAFGKLPAIAFETAVASPAPTNYAINTISGQLPVLPDRATVYQIAQPQSDLLDLSNAKALIPQSDFPNDPQPLSDSIYQWTSPNPPFKILTYNILTHDFTLTSSYVDDPTVIAAVNLGDEAGAITTAKQFLSGFGAYNDIDESKTKTTLYTINGTTKILQPVVRLADAQIIQVDFFQNDLDKVSLFYPSPPHSLLTVFVASSGVVAAMVTNKTLTNLSGTYPIKTADQAFTELQSGSSSAYIASPANPPVSPVTITDVFLAYFVRGYPQDYLMPVIVFQGDNGFYAYVSAVADSWIEKTHN